MNRALTWLFGITTVLFGAATLFFSFFGVRLIHHALTFSGPGSLGHVGMFIAAFVYPLLAILFGFLTWQSWRAARRRRVTATPGNAPGDG